MLLFKVTPKIIVFGFDFAREKGVIGYNSLMIRTLEWLVITHYDIVIDFLGSVRQNLFCLI